ncbi:MAG: zinc ribbon domain-containing protein YjdM [Halobacteriovoraceae bacterium]|nr:zinc ribbon domain-containing protein YjdM [Halobacteriovoraceae bacterium]
MNENNSPPCPQCQSPYPYQDGPTWVCPECSHEFTEGDIKAAVEAGIIRDSNGNVLQDGDSVTVIKDLKIKGSSNSVKVGTKVKNIRLLIDAVDGHDIACKVDGIGAMNLKSEFVKKA